MNKPVRALVATILVFALATALAGAAAIVSLTLGWLEGHPEATDILVWFIGTLAVIFVTYLVGSLWMRLYHRLGEEFSDDE